MFVLNNQWKIYIILLLLGIGVVFVNKIVNNTACCIEKEKLPGKRIDVLCCYVIRNITAIPLQYTNKVHSAK